MSTTSESTFYDRLIALTTHTYLELEELHKIKTECDNTGIDIRNITNISVMLNSMQVLTASIDTIAKISRKHITEEPQEEDKYPGLSNYKGGE